MPAKRRRLTGKQAAPILPFFPHFRPEPGVERGDDHEECPAPLPSCAPLHTPVPMLIPADFPGQASTAASSSQPRGFMLYPIVNARLANERRNATNLDDSQDECFEEESDDAVYDYG